MSHAPDENIARIRPRFKIESKENAKTISDKIVIGLNSEGATCIGKVNHNFITLLLPANEQHYWSPQLTITFEEWEGVTTIRGLYGPRPTVWTMFVFFYSIIGLAVLVIGTFGLSQLMLGNSTGILWWMPVLTIVFLSLYLVSYFGQKMGHNQMEILHNFFEKASGLEVD